MLRILRLFLVTCALIAAGCSPIAASTPTTKASPPTATFTPAPQETATQAPTPTKKVPASPTPVPSDVATLTSMVGSMGALVNIQQYFNPTGTPVQNWGNVPIMPEATAGQQYSPNIYSFVAAATLDQARQFYAARAAELGLPSTPTTGTGGSGSQAEHDSVFFSYGLTIALTAFDNDPGHVIVVISRA